MWAGLLATASQDTDAVSPSFAETLKQLTPDEARYLQRLHDDALKEKRRRYFDLLSKTGIERHPELLARANSVAHTPIPYTAFPLVRGKSEKEKSPDTYERLGLIQKRYDVHNKESGEALADAGYVPTYQAELGIQYLFTEYADHFMQACQGPSAAGSESDATAPEPGQ
jgi:hypothetical protein